MFDQSIIKTSGQWLKLLGFFFGTVGGGAVMFAGLRDLRADGGGVLLILAGMLVAIASLVFGVVAIRCPRCKARWLWRAMSDQQHSQWFSYVLAQSSCPSCSYSPQAGSQVTGTNSA